MSVQSSGIDDHVESAAPYLWSATVSEVPRHHMTEFKDQHDVTELLQRWNRSGELPDELLFLVYEHLKTLSSKRLRKERSGHTLQTGDLVHEAYLRLSDKDQTDFRDRHHFYAIASELMRRVLIDHARKNAAGKRIGHELLVPLETLDDVAVGPDTDVLALDLALTKLAALDEIQAKVVELRSFAGLTLEETADVLGISRSSVARDWKTAKLWLRRELTRQR